MSFLKIEWILEDVRYPSWYAVVSRIDGKPRKFDSFNKALLMKHEDVAFSQYGKAVYTVWYYEYGEGSVPTLIAVSLERSKIEREVVDWIENECFTAKKEVNR